ncbi:hypothetical protein [Acinetobacter baretiae]|uniref:hypothetical protein n=1 Tax=Acinetobacter baretiae TaxID=2605383 RepID=UPI001F160092|nr:hypothetical protein [Acinetobacter baretiae]
MSYLYGCIMNYLNINVRRILSILSISLISQCTFAQSTLVSDSSRNFTFFIFALLFILTFVVIYLAAKKIQRQVISIREEVQFQDAPMVLQLQVIIYQQQLF